MKLFAAVLLLALVLLVGCAQPGRRREVYALPAPVVGAADETAIRLYPELTPLE